MELSNLLWKGVEAASGAAWRWAHRPRKIRRLHAEFIREMRRGLPGGDVLLAGSEEQAVHLEAERDARRAAAASLKVELEGLLDARVPVEDAAKKAVQRMWRLYDCDGQPESNEISALHGLIEMACRRGMRGRFAARLSGS